MQGLIQPLLEDEVAELLGRVKSERRAALDAPAGSRNGHGKPRQLALMNGTITVRRPRVRDMEERFVSRLLPLFQRRTPEVSALLPKLYLHGLALGDFELALRGLLGDAAPLSASSLVRLKATWQAQYAAWHQRDLSDLKLVYLWADGVYVKAGLTSADSNFFVAVIAEGALTAIVAFGREPSNTSLDLIEARKLIRNARVKHPFHELNYGRMRA